MKDIKSIAEKILNHKAFWISAAVLLSVITPNPAFGLIAGCLLALIFDNPLKQFTGKASKILLQTSVVLLGFGLQFAVIIKVGISSIGITFTGIAMTLIIGIILGRIFRLEKNLATLITSGTAICGGSAIAAMAPAIGAAHAETAMAMAVVFFLNAIGLVVFPPLGHIFGMNQETFGLWAAIAIHDTSSVVGAAAAYGTTAAMIATTVKLTRALWILPLSFGAAKLNKSETKPKFQWFLIGFMAAGLIRSLIPTAEPVWNTVAAIGKHMMTGTLFLVGSVLTFSEIKKIGARPLIMAVVLWAIISVLSFAAIYSGLWSIPADIIFTSK